MKLTWCGEVVQATWRNLNVNLLSLVQKIISFFESEEFNNVTAFETERGYEIIVGDSKRYKMGNDVSVTIEGKPDEFTINLTSTKKEKGPSIPLMLAQMIGAGYFALKELKSEEAMQKLEKEFKLKINSIIAQARQTQETAPQQDKSF